MKKIASPLFQDLSEAELDTLAAAGHLRTRQFAKHEVIFRAGSCVREIGIVLRGSVHIENLDLWGTKSILSSVGAGQAFAETYAFCGEALMVDAVAAEHCEILFLHTAALTDARIEPALQDKLLRRLLAAQEPQPFAAHLLHNAQDCARTATDLFFRTGSTLRQDGVRGALQPPADGRLPQSGPQRPLQRAVQNAGRRFAGI